MLASGSTGYTEISEGQSAALPSFVSQRRKSYANMSIARLVSEVVVHEDRHSRFSKLGPELNVRRAPSPEVVRHGHNIYSLCAPDEQTRSSQAHLTGSMQAVGITPPASNRLALLHTYWTEHVPRGSPGTNQSLPVSPLALIPDLGTTVHGCDVSDSLYESHGDRLPGATFE